MNISIILASLLICCTGAQAALKPATEKSLEKPIVIAHRGASGHRPEHTLEAYQLAIEMGADYIEPDLVITKDGILIARHENEISGTTDVATKFPDRKTKKTIDGQNIEGWFTEDFTFKEIKTLRAKERLEFRSHKYDGKFLIPTFQEVIDLAKKKSVGLYPETKHPSYFASIGLPFEDRLVKILHDNGFKDSNAKVFIQAFELDILKKLKILTELRLVFLFDEPAMRPYDFVLSKDSRTYADLLKPEALRELAKTVQGIGPWKRLIVPEDKDGNLLEPTSLVKDAHAARLLVHPYTFRSDGIYLAKAYKGDPKAEYQQFLDLGVDGVFSDFPDHAVKGFEKRR